MANGSLFTYFPTKTELFNQLFLELKGEMAAAALAGVPAKADLRKQFFHVWQNWTNWATVFPEKRSALAQLAVSGEITTENHLAAQKLMSGLSDLADRSRSDGPMKKTSLAVVLTLMTSVAEATMELMQRDPANARKHCREGFEAVWRMVH